MAANVAVMGANEYGPWEPLALSQAISLMKSASFPWWISGGHALELFANQSWRTHDDTDISILRQDARELPNQLQGWDVRLAAGGALTQWDGQLLVEDHSHNNLWCRLSPDRPWALDVTISDGDTTHWIYRRDRSIRIPWESAILHTPDGTPFLAPELQLLFKSKSIRPKDTLDADTVIPLLTSEQRNRLASALPKAHAWQMIIG